MSDSSCSSEGASSASDSEGASSASEGASSASSSLASFEDPIWKTEACHAWVDKLRPRFRGRGRRLRLLLPCAGFDAPGQALDAMQISYSVTGAWDICPAAAKVLCARYTDKKILHLGRDAGDVLRPHLSSLPDADGLIAGPPCPPFSCMGSGGGWDDKRSEAFLRILDWIGELANREVNPLRFFILENVMGILHQGSKKGEAPVKHIVRKLKACLQQQSWHLSVLRTSSECTGQSRPRVYIVGHCMAHGQNTVDDYMQTLPSKTLSQVLAKLPDSDPKKHLTPKQRNHLKIQLERAKRIHSKRGKEMTMSWDADRDPDKQRSKINCKDIASCLRHKAPKRWVVRMKSGQTTMSRLLHLAEICLLQGMSPREMPCTLSRMQIARGVGNAMSVPVVGSILNAVLLAVGHFLDPGCAGRPSSISSVDEGSSSFSPSSSSKRRRSLLCESAPSSSSAASSDSDEGSSSVDEGSSSSSESSS